MELQIASKKQSKLLIALEGEAGSGKTKSSLLLAYGITGNWGKIAVIDTENGSASFYSHLGPYNTLEINGDYPPRLFIEAIELCQRAGIEAIVLDSMSSEWAGNFGVIDSYCAIEGDSYKKWDETMPVHREFMDTILYSDAHIIATIRTIDGVPQAEKGYEHFFTTVLSLNEANEVTVKKDRTQVCKRQAPFIITPSLGAEFYKWSSSEQAGIPSELQTRINNCKTINQLYSILLKQDVPMEYMEAFTKRAIEIEGLPSLQRFTRA